MQPLAEQFRLPLFKEMGDTLAWQSEKRSCPCE